MPEKAGTKYVCEVCGGTVIVVKASDGEIQCHGQPMKEGG